MQEQQHKNIPLNYFDSLNNIKQNYKPSEINTNKLSSEPNFIPSSFYRNNQIDIANNINKTLDKQDWSYNNPITYITCRTDRIRPKIFW